MLFGIYYYVMLSWPLSFRVSDSYVWLEAGAGSQCRNLNTALAAAKSFVCLWLRLYNTAGPVGWPSQIFYFLSHGVLPLFAGVFILENTSFPGGGGGNISRFHLEEKNLERGEKTGEM